MILHRVYNGFHMNFKEATQTLTASTLEQLPTSPNGLNTNMEPTPQCQSHTSTSELELALLQALDDKDTTSTPLITANAAGALSTLSDMSLWRIVSFLSPEDLCSLASCNTYFKTLASDNAIWRAVYTSRWPAGPSKNEIDDDDQLEQEDWKRLYMQRDALELNNAVQRAPEGLQQLYLQMAIAKRSEPLPPLHRDALVNLHTTANKTSAPLSTKISDFKKQRNTTTTGPSTPACRTCQYTQLDDEKVWMCEVCCKIHVCGENTCKEFKLDPVSSMPICPISGRCFDRLMTEQEEQGEQVQDDNGRGGGGGDDWNADECVSGRLGRAFFAGYHAANEQEMLRQFGVKF